MLEQLSARLKRAESRIEIASESASESASKSASESAGKSASASRDLNPAGEHFFVACVVRACVRACMHAGSPTSGIDPGTIFGCSGV